MHDKSISDKKIQWHPGFYTAAEIELRQNRADLEYHREYNLSKKPLQIDLLVIEKLKDVQSQNEIGKIFRRYNIIEYKSPDDGLTVDDFVKTLGYAYLYKGLGEKVNEIPLEELTVSLFRDAKPLKLMKELIRYGSRIKKHAEGIYYIEGLLIPAQIIVTRELESREHPALRILAKKVTESDIRNFAEYVNHFTEPGDKQNADAVLQVSVSANQRIYNEVRRRTKMDALKELFKEELEDAHKEGERKGENRLNVLYNRLDRDGRKEDIFRAMKNPEILQKLFKEYGMK